MKVTVENKKGLNKDVKVFVDKKTMNNYMDEKYEEIKGNVNLKGFRPGKVPREVLKRQFGKAIFGEVLDKVLKGLLGLGWTALLLIGIFFAEKNEKN